MEIIRTVYGYRRTTYANGYTFSLPHADDDFYAFAIAHSHANAGPHLHADAASDQHNHPYSHAYPDADDHPHPGAYLDVATNPDARADGYSLANGCPAWTVNAPGKSRGLGPGDALIAFQLFGYLRGQPGIMVQQSQVGGQAGALTLLDQLFQ